MMATGRFCWLTWLNNRISIHQTISCTSLHTAACFIETAGHLKATNGRQWAARGGKEFSNLESLECANLVEAEQRAEEERPAGLQQEEVARPQVLPCFLNPKPYPSKHGSAHYVEAEHRAEVGRPAGVQQQ